MKFQSYPIKGLLYGTMDERKSFWKALYKYKVHHLVMWLSYFAFFIIFYKNYYPSWLSLLIAIGIYFVFNATAFYTIGYYLFPKFLYKDNYKRFVLFAAVLLVGLSALLTAVLYVCFWKYIPPDMATIPNLFQISLISIVPMAGFMSGGKLIIDKIKSDRIGRRMEQQRTESELQYLKAQVNPHFLFNAINSVYFLIKKDPDLAAQTLIRLSDLLRFQLYDCSDEKISIEKEIEYLTNFISLEKIRKGDKINVIFDKVGNLSGFQIAPFLLIPYLENAFKYVSTSSDRKNEIGVKLERTGNTLIATFSNTIEATIKSEVGGIGHKNVERRLNLLYPGRHELRLSDTRTSYNVYLSLDVE